MGAIASNAIIMTAWTGLMGVYISAFYWLESARTHKTLFYLCIAAALAYGWHQRAFFKILIKQKLFAIIAVYLGYQIISLGWSDVYSLGELGEAVRKSVLTLLFILSISLATLRPKFWRGVMLIAALCAGISIGLWLNDPSAPRLSGIGRSLNPIQAGTLYGIAAILAFWHLLAAAGTSASSNTSGARLKLAYALAWAVIIVALLLTQSRGAWLAALVGHSTLLMLMVAPRLHTKRLRLPLIVVLGASLFTFIIASSWLIDWAEILQRADGYRFAIWQSALSAMQSQPFFGLGYRQEFSYLLPYGDTIYQQHSLYIAALYYGGAVGLLLLLALFGYALHGLWKARNLSPIVPLWIALALNAAIFGLFDYDILLVNSKLPWLLFWIPISAALAVGVIGVKQEPHAHTS